MQFYIVPLIVANLGLGLISGAGAQTDPSFDDPDCLQVIPVDPSDQHASTTCIPRSMRSTSSVQSVSVSPPAAISSTPTPEGNPITVTFDSITTVLPTITVQPNTVTVNNTFTVTSTQTDSFTVTSTQNFTSTTTATTTINNTLTVTATSTPSSTPIALPRPSHELPAAAVAAISVASTLALLGLLILAAFLRKLWLRKKATDSAKKAGFWSKLFGRDDPAAKKGPTTTGPLPDPEAFEMGQWVRASQPGGDSSGKRVEAELDSRADWDSIVRRHAEANRGR